MRFREPLLIPFASVAAGITLAKLCPLTLVESLWAGLILSVLAVIAFRLKFRVAGWTACVSALICGGAALVSIHGSPPRPVLSVPDNVPAILEGCVVDPALVAADRERFTLELTPGARAQVSLYARDGESFPDLPYGTRIEFEGKVRRPHNYNNPGGFDYVSYLAQQHIYWTASGNAATVHVLPGRCGSRLLGFVYGMRSAALERLDRLYARDPYSDGMMQAVLIGATAKLDRMWTEDYRSTGTFHALIISGSHVAVIAAVLLLLLRVCAVPPGIALGLAIIAAWLYSGITGWQAPVVRSAAGMTLYGIARCFYREGRLLNIVAGVALLFVLVNPRQLFDPSFQLSFLAVALIGAFVVPALDATSGPLSSGLANLDDAKQDIRLAPATAQFRIEMRLLARTLSLCLRVPPAVASSIVVFPARICLYVYDIFITSLFIQIGLALPMVVYFHRLSMSGLSANAIVVPVLSTVVPVGFLAIATQSQLLAAVCAWLLSVSRATVGWHAQYEPSFRIPGPPVWLAVLFVCALVWAALRVTRTWIRFAAWTGAVVCLSLIVLHPFAPVVERGRFELSAIDVGQGDSLLASFPDGKLMLIDAGGIPQLGRGKKPGIDIGADVVSPYLWSRSIKRLDVVAMTHAHTDHMGGMPAVLENFRPRELWTGVTPSSPEWDEVLHAADRLHIRVRPMRRSPPFPFGGACIEIVAPLPDYEPELTPKNNDSLAMRVQYGNTSFLLTGDMEKRIEEELVVNGALQHVDVLKVGHHGSRTSSTPEFLDALHPAFGVVSVGFENGYGHPHPTTLAALEERHIAMLRTDERGLVTIVSDGRRLRINSPALPGLP